MTTEPFIKLPNILVRDLDNKRENTYSFLYSEKLCHIWSAFDCLMNRVGTISFSLEILITESGVVADNHAGRNVEQYRNILIKLEENKFITDVRCDLKKIKYKELIMCEYSIPQLVNKDSKDTQFFMITREDYLNILKHKTKLNKITLLYLYYYLISRMKITKTGTVCCYPSYIQIMEDLDISNNTLTSYLKELNILNLIYYESIGVLVKNGKQKNANNVYVKHPSHMRDALDMSKTYWKNEGWLVTNKKVSVINEQIKGYKGQITKQSNQGKDVTKLEDKLFELESKIANNVDRSRNDIKREIILLSDEMIDLDNKNKLTTFVNVDIEGYFTDLKKDIYIKEDCEEVLKHMQNINKEQLKELAYKNGKHVGLPNPNKQPINF